MDINLQNKFNHDEYNKMDDFYKNCSGQLVILTLETTTEINDDGESVTKIVLPHKKKSILLIPIYPTMDEAIQAIKTHPRANGILARFPKDSDDGLEMVIDPDCEETSLYMQENLDEYLYLVKTDKGYHYLNRHDGSVTGSTQRVGIDIHLENKGAFVAGSWHPVMQDHYKVVDKRDNARPYTKEDYDKICAKYPEAKSKKDTKDNSTKQVGRPKKKSVYNGTDNINPILRGFLDKFGGRANIANHLTDTANLYIELKNMCDNEKMDYPDFEPHDEIVKGYRNTTYIKRSNALTHRINYKGIDTLVWHGIASGGNPSNAVRDITNGINNAIDNFDNEQMNEELLAKLLTQDDLTPKIEIGSVTGYIKTEASPEIVIYTPSRFKEAYVEEKYNDNEGKSKSLAIAYINFKGKTSYKKLGFNIINPDPDIYDTYRPNINQIECSDETGRFFDNIMRESIKKPDDKDWLIQWAARIHRNPGYVSQMMPILAGQSGTGKSFITKSMITMPMGIYGKVDGTIDDLLGSFNDAYANKCIIQLDDIPKLDKNNRMNMKRLLTSDIVNYNKKHEVAFEMKNISNYIGCTDEMGNIISTTNDRRFKHISTNPDFDKEKYLFPVLKELGIPLLQSGERKELIPPHAGKLISWFIDQYDPEFPMDDWMTTIEQTEILLEDQYAIVRHFYYDVFCKLNTFHLNTDLIDSQSDTFALESLAAMQGIINKKDREDDDPNQKSTRKEIREMFKKCGLKKRSGNSNDYNRYTTIDFDDFKERFAKAYGIVFE